MNIAQLQFSALNMLVCKQTSPHPAWLLPLPPPPSLLPRSSDKTVMERMIYYMLYTQPPGVSRVNV